MLFRVLSQPCSPLMLPPENATPAFVGCLGGSGNDTALSIFVVTSLRGFVGLCPGGGELKFVFKRPGEAS